MQIIIEHTVDGELARLANPGDPLAFVLTEIETYRDVIQTELMSAASIVVTISVGDDHDIAALSRFDELA